MTPPDSPRPSEQLYVEGNAPCPICRNISIHNLDKHDLYERGITEGRKLERAAVVAYLDRNGHKAWDFVYRIGAGDHLHPEPGRGK